MLTASLSFALLVNSCPPEVGLTEAEVYHHLVKRRNVANDTPLRDPEPKSGHGFLVRQGASSHFGLLALLRAADGDKDAVKRKQIIDCALSVVARQDCPRWRFVPWAERYAVGDRGDTGVDVDTQCRAIRLLGQIGNADHATELAKLIDDDEWVVRRDAITAIGQIGNSRHAERVLARLDKIIPNESPRSRVERELVTDTFKKLIATPDPNTPKK